jgi:hypothetical protein
MNNLLTQAMWIKTMQIFELSAQFGFLGCPSLLNGDQADIMQRC